MPSLGGSVLIVGICRQNLLQAESLHQGGGGTTPVLIRRRVMLPPGALLLPTGWPRSFNSLIQIGFDYYYYYPSVITRLLIMAAARSWQPPALDLQKSGPPYYGRRLAD